MINAQLFHADAPVTAVDVGDWARLSADDANLLWVDLEAPSSEELTTVSRLFAIDPRATAILAQRNRLPTVRTYRGHYLVTAVSVDVDETPRTPRISVVELDVIAGRNFLVSLHHRPLPFAAALRERTSANAALGKFDSSYLLYVILDTLVGHYAREFDEVEDEVERLEGTLLRDPGRRTLDETMLMKRHIHKLRRLVVPHREMLGALVAADSPVPEQQVESYFRDLLQHFGGLIERLDHARDIVSGSYSIYISNVSYRTNQQLRVLTFLSAVLLPMTVVTGIFGTNFALPEYESRAPFYVMVGGMMAIVVSMLAFFRRRRWL